jgi:hypothetical protein
MSNKKAGKVAQALSKSAYLASASPWVWSPVQDGRKEVEREEKREEGKKRAREGAKKKGKESGLQFSPVPNLLTASETLRLRVSCLLSLHLQ